MTAGFSFADVFAVLSEGQRAGLVAWVVSGANTQDLPSGDVAFAAKVYAALEGDALTAARGVITSAMLSSGDSSDAEPEPAPRKGKGKGKGNTPAASANDAITLPSVRIDTALLFHSSNENHAHWSGTVAGLKVQDSPYAFAKGALKGKGRKGEDAYLAKTGKIVLTILFASRILECAGDASAIDALDAKVKAHLGAGNARMFVGQRDNREWLAQAIEDVKVARKG